MAEVTRRSLMRLAATLAAGRSLPAAALGAKFTDLADGVLPPGQTRKLIDLCWNIEQLRAAGALARAAVPFAVSAP